LGLATFTLSPANNKNLNHFIYHLNYNNITSNVEAFQSCGRYQLGKQQDEPHGGPEPAKERRQQREADGHGTAERQDADHFVELDPEQPDTPFAYRLEEGEQCG